MMNNALEFSLYHIRNAIRFALIKLYGRKGRKSSLGQ